MAFTKSFQKKSIVYILLLAIIVFFCLATYKYNKNTKNKVLLIGLDGADWKIMHLLIDKGELPNIKKIMENGCWGDLQNFEPVVSEVIWTSMATGKIPEKHGILDRLMQEQNSGVEVPVTSNLRKVKAIWDILSESNKRAGVVHYMVTWPPEKVNGVLVSDRVMDIEDINYLSKNRSYPDFTKICSENAFNNFKKDRYGLFSNINRNRFPYFWWKIEGIDNFMANLSIYLLKKQKFDFFCLYLEGIDVVSHNFWHFLFPEGFDVSEGEIKKYKDVILNYYIWCDKIVGEMLKSAGRDTTVIIVSDHGFMTRRKNAYLFSAVDYLLEISGINKISIGSHIAILKNEPADIHSFNKNIKITGDFSENELNEIRQEAKNVLKNIKVEETGEYIFKEFKDTKNGFVIIAPQLYMKKNPEYHILVNGKEYKIMDLLINHVFSGGHSRSGIIIITGKGARHKKIITNANVYDITPTILYYMGIPIAKDMDGKVLFEAIEEDYIKSNPIRYIDTYETFKDKTIQKPIRSLLDEERIKEKMRSLGYIN
jgi:predicted AlkP superfamily phosphohydrolase/phosphomutase